MTGDIGGDPNYRRGGAGSVADVAEYGDGQFESGFVVRDPAWHGLADVLLKNVKTREAIVAAGLDWQVEEWLLKAQPPVPGTNEAISKQVTVEAHKALVRSSDGSVLGVVGSGYSPLQNADAFDFIDTLLDDGEAHWHTAGSLKQGKRVWMLAELHRDITVAGWEDERVLPFVLLSNGHDGRMSLTVAVTPVRVVCQNTLNYALRNTQRVWRARHTSGMTGRVQEARRTLGLAFKYMDELEQLGQAMLKERMDKQAWGRFIKRLVPYTPAMEDDRGGRAAKNVDEARAAITLVWREADNLANIRETKWGALQAVTEWSDWYKPVRDRGKGLDENRFARVMDETDVKDRALALLAPAYVPAKQAAAVAVGS